MTFPSRLCGVVAFAFAMLFGVDVDAQNTDGLWQADAIKDVGAFASVTGNVINGDRFQVAVRGEHCDFGNVFFSAYSYYKKPDFAELQGKTIRLRHNGAVREGKVVSATPFLLGHIAYISLGVEPLEFVKKRYSSVPHITVELLGDDGAPNKYFDIPNNDWNVAGFPEALEQAQVICRQHASQKAKSG